MAQTEELYSQIVKFLVYYDLQAFESKNRYFFAIKWNFRLVKIA